MKYSMIHSCIRVFDLDRSEAFYQSAFGFEISRKMDFPEHRFTLSYLRTPGEQFELELTYNYDQEQAYELGNGYSHLAVGVSDLEASHQSHQAMGFEPGTLKGLAGGKPKFYFVADPDGYLVEVVRT